jgi:uncharacterized protein YaeQ
MKYTFNLQVSDNKREHTEKLIMGAFDNEAGSHIALKLLAYMMFFDRKPRIDEDAGWQVVPDLIARSDDGTISLWVDCGSVSNKKVDTVATKVRDIEFYVFRKTQREMDHFYSMIKDKIKHIQNVRCVSFDDGFVDGVAECLDRTNNVECYFGDDMVTLTVENSFGRHEAYSSVRKI